MSYIKLKIQRRSDATGRTLHAMVSGMESDMPPLATLQPNMVYHAIARRTDVQMWMVVEEGLLGRDMLADSEALKLGEGMLNVDNLY